MKRIVPLNDIVIVKIIEREPKSAGGIVLTTKSVEKSTEAEVLIPNTFSYHRDGTLKPSMLCVGDIVRLERGNVGTELPEAPEGETWLAVPEDCIYYKVENV